MSRSLASLALFAVLCAAATARAQSAPGSMGMGGMGSMGGMGGAPPPKGSGEDLLPEVDESVAGDAQKTFDRAEAAFQARDWLAAIAHYRHVMQKYSFNLPLTARCELRLGDVAFARERFSEARGYYKSFLRFHPKHEQADDAAFRVGLCAFYEIPRGMFFEPPTEERDQSPARGALDQMRDFVARYPTSSHVEEANRIVVQCEDKLAAHELYVARFYAKRGKWRGTALRCEGLARSFPHSTLAPEALALAVEAHATLKERELAQKDLEALEGLAPDAGLVARARKAVRQLD